MAVSAAISVGACLGPAFEGPLPAKLTQEKAQESRRWHPAPPTGRLETWTRQPRAPISSVEWEDGRSGPIRLCPDLFIIWCFVNSTSREGFRSCRDKNGEIAAYQCLSSIDSIVKREPAAHWVAHCDQLLISSAVNYGRGSVKYGATSYQDGSRAQHIIIAFTFEFAQLVDGNIIVKATVAIVEACAASPTAPTATAKKSTPRKRARSRQKESKT